MGRPTVSAHWKPIQGLYVLEELGVYWTSEDGEHWIDPQRVAEVPEDEVAEYVIRLLGGPLHGEVVS
jgi:hypothetical protein